MDISVSGKVSSDGEPINMIEITVYRDDVELDHVFTGEDGQYRLSIPEGNLVAVRFDTHSTLNNANEWHPSVVANLDASKDIVLDRNLLRVGSGKDFAAFIDALSGYEYAAFWEEKSPDKQYASSAATRLGPMKLPNTVLQEVQLKLQNHFLARSQAP